MCRTLRGKTVVKTKAQGSKPHTVCDSHKRYAINEGKPLSQQKQLYLLNKLLFHRLLLASTVYNIEILLMYEGLSGFGKSVNTNTKHLS